MALQTSDNQLIVALDLPDKNSALSLVKELGSLVNFYKIGLSMLSSGGLSLARELKHNHQKRVFLDLKLFDIEATVSTAVRSIVNKVEPDFLTVHGDPHVVRAATQAKQNSQTQILAVTILTSLDRDDLDESMLCDGEVVNIAVERANRALKCGADGVISSPLEAKKIRNLDAAVGRLIITPGTRPIGSNYLDQKRVATPAEALLSGANHIVIGRPITQSQNPKIIVRDILKSLP